MDEITIDKEPYNTIRYYSGYYKHYGFTLMLDDIDYIFIEWINGIPDGDILELENEIKKKFNEI